MLFVFYLLMSYMQTSIVARLNKRQRVEFKLSVLVFNCLHNLAPSYLSTMCQLVADNAGCRRLRSAARGDLAVPATRTLQYGPHSFAMAGPSTWNSLPAPLCSRHLKSGVTKHHTGRTSPKYSDILHWISSKVTKCKSEMHENRNPLLFLIEINNMHNTRHIFPIPMTCILGRCGWCGVLWHHLTSMFRRNLKTELFIRAYH